MNTTCSCEKLIESWHKNNKKCGEMGLEKLIKSVMLVGFSGAGAPLPNVFLQRLRKKLKSKTQN